MYIKNVKAEKKYSEHHPGSLQKPTAYHLCFPTYFFVYSINPAPDYIKCLHFYM